RSPGPRDPTVGPPCARRASGKTISIPTKRACRMTNGFSRSTNATWLLMKELEDSGQLANTLVVYTADQGFGLGEHGFNQKVAPYDATVASSLIISRPGT